jgi:hypothetical protein
MDHIRHTFRGRRINGIPETVQLRDLPSHTTTWVSAALAPCFFLAAVARDETGRIQGVNAGHFSARFESREIERQLMTLDVPAERKRILIAGMSQRTNRQTLEESISKLVASIRACGLPVDLEWESPDRPWLRDSRSQQLVSDLGLGLIENKPTDLGLGRLVSLGVTDSHAVLVSTVYRRSPELGMIPLQTHLITEEAGIITKDHQ